MNERDRKLSIKTKLGFSSGSLEEAMVGAAGVTTMIFYNQVLGLPPALCGWAFAIASAVDAISDPLVGALSDSVKTRWGRRHPFMFLSALPLSICFYLLYQPPSGLSETALFLWMSGTMIGVRLAKTFYSVPHAALGAELTDDYDERTSIFGWNWIVGLLGSVSLGIFIMYVIFPSTPAVANGLLNEPRYAFLAIFGAVFCFLMIMLCTFSTADQIPHLHERRPSKASGHYVRRFFSETLRNFKALLKNRSYIAICACWLVLAISGGIIAILGTYTFVYAFEFSTEQIALRDIVRVPGALMVILLSGWLVKRLDKKLTVIATIIIAAFLVGLPYCLRLLGWLPDNGTTMLLVVFFSIWLLGYIALPVVPVVIDSQLVDVADEHELQTGNRAEGAIFSIRTFAIKLTQGIGGLIAGFGLEYIGFPENASPATVSAEVIDSLLFMMGPMYYIIVYGGLGFALLYNIDRKRHEEIMAQLIARRKETAMTAPVDGT